MRYWLDCFTGTTWEEFRNAGATISGFNSRFHKHANTVKKGDIFLCYLVGVKRWVGVLEVIGQSNNTNVIWKDGDFPVRFEVSPIVLLDAEHGIPMDELEGKVDFFQNANDRPGYRGFVRRSPNLFKRESDGALLVELIKGALANPVPRPVDPKLLARKPFLTAERRQGKATETVLVSVPDPEVDEEVQSNVNDVPASGTRHTEIQHALLTLGIDLGMSVWVARNDRGKTYDNVSLGSLPSVVDDLPTQFNEATNATIELIDVLWLQGNSITAAFEVECTTSVYSGLLRMSDLLALQPNLDIKLFLVAPDERRSKVKREILRPTFTMRDKPLPKLCGFLSFSSLMKQIEGIRVLGLARSLKPDFLLSIAEYFKPEGD